MEPKRNEEGTEIKKMERSRGKSGTFDSAAHGESFKLLKKFFFGGGGLGGGVLSYDY